MYVLFDFTVKLGVVIIAIVVIIEVTPTVLANMEALAFYVKNFGVRQGFEMYKYLGVANLPNGVISWLQADMADGDSSVDDLGDKGEGITGTVWDNVTSTSDNIPTTEIPTTFRINLADSINYKNPVTGTNTLWTNANYFGTYGNWELGINTKTGIVFHALMVD